MVFDPFLVNGNIPFEKMKPGIVHEGSQTIVGQVHSINFPIGFRHGSTNQVTPDETVHPKNQDLHS